MLPQEPRINDPWTRVEAEKLQDEPYTFCCARCEKTYFKDNENCQNGIRDSLKGSHWLSLGNTKLKNK